MAITWPRRDLKIEDLKVAQTAVWICLTPCLVMHLLMALYLSTGSDSFQSIRCNECRMSLSGILEVVDPAQPRTHLHRRCQQNVPLFSVVRVRRHLVPKNNQWLVAAQQCPDSLRSAGQQGFLNQGHLANLANKKKPKKQQIAVMQSASNLAEDKKCGLSSLLGMKVQANDTPLE